MKMRKAYRHDQSIFFESSETLKQKSNPNGMYANIGTFCVRYIMTQSLAMSSILCPYLKNRNTYDKMSHVLASWEKSYSIFCKPTEPLTSFPRLIWKWKFSNRSLKQFEKNKSAPMNKSLKCKQAYTEYFTNAFFWKECRSLFGPRYVYMEASISRWQVTISWVTIPSFDLFK